MLSVKHPLVAVACLCLRPLPSMWQANLRWPSSERSVGIGSHHILSIYCHFCGPAEPKESWAVYQSVIYYLHYTLITIIANIIICFHVELSVRPMYECLARGRLSNLLYSLSLSACRGSRGVLFLARSLLCIFRFILPIFHLIYELSTLGWPSRYLPNDKYSFYSPLSSHAISISLSLFLALSLSRLYTNTYIYTQV